MSNLTINVLGFPRVGEKRELKVAVESFWKGKITKDELEQVARDLREKHWLLQRDGGVNLIPSNDFSYYDQVLDMSCLLGNIPARFGKVEGNVSLEKYFEIARGSKDLPAAEMTKWFDTNYHYIVPEFDAETEFKVASEKIFAEFVEAKNLGLTTKPVLLGPVSYLALGKGIGEERYELLPRLLPVYGEILRRLSELGAEWVQFDEPIFAGDLWPEQQLALRDAYRFFGDEDLGVKVILTNYFDSLGENKTLFFSLPAAGYHVDAVAGEAEIEEVSKAVPEGAALSVGIVNGRNIWKNDFTKSIELLERVQERLGSKRLWVATSCSLLHSPYGLRHESGLDRELIDWLAFGEEKLKELGFLSAYVGDWKGADTLRENQASHKARRKSPRLHRPEIEKRMAKLQARDFRRTSKFSARQKVQHERLNLPLFPTTTIGSFPQTKEIRAARAKWRKGKLSDDAYEGYLKVETEKCIRAQEELGLDLLVHGEFERTDMVEFFGEKLDGFAFTKNGWVQSYGSRCVKPPVIFGDVARPEPMTVESSTYAQSLTNLPVKGMLTGPITILQWSFVRDDQARAVTAQQIALAIRDEVVDLEAAKLPAIQIDEPALREGLPLRKAEWESYLHWAVGVFRLSSSGVKDATQIHTHMCYCEFNDIISSIADLDADVITIETSRSNMELLDAFAEFEYPNEIGPGVYDIHSPRVPSADEMRLLIEKAASVIPVENLWVNPDCGLKTRGWEEVTQALGKLVDTARSLREAYNLADGSRCLFASVSSPRSSNDQS